MREKEEREDLRRILSSLYDWSLCDIKKAAEAHGHAWATIRRAQLDLGIKPVKVGKAWHWKLPGSSQDAQDAQFR